MCGRELLFSVVMPCCLLTEGGRFHAWQSSMLFAFIFVSSVLDRGGEGGADKG